MPPKKTGRGRKKVVSVMSATVPEGDSLKQNGKEFLPDNNAAENEKEPNAAKKRGRPKSKEAKTTHEQLNGNEKAVDSAEHFKNGAENDVEVNEGNSKKRGLRRIAPPQSTDIASESDLIANVKGEKIQANQNARKTKEEKKNARRKSAEASPSHTSEEDLKVDKEADESSQTAKENQSLKPLSDVESGKDKGGAPNITKGRSGKNASQKAMNAEQSSNLVDTQPKEVLPKGRKRKNVEVQKEDVLGNRCVKVSLLRQKSVDDMALDLLRKSEVAVKTAAGPSKPRGKRAREDEGDGAKPAKASKASSKMPKTKIPDVSVLDFNNTSTNASGESWNMKIVSWNINGIRAWLEKDGVSYLHHEKPDIVCFQETKCSKDKLPQEANVDGYHCFWLGGDKDGYSGVGLLSKQKPLSVDYGIGLQDHDSEGRVITADYDKFYLVAAYVPNAGRGLVRLDYRKQWDEDFRAYLKKLDQTKPVILCGDLNVAHQEIDLANPKTNKKNAGFTKEEREGFSALLSEGFVDAYRLLNPDATGVYTFWTYMMNARAKNVGWRIDYFVMSTRFTTQLCDCCTRKDVMGSDHCPLVLFLHV